MSERQKPWDISKEELNLRWAYGRGKITLAEFNRQFDNLKRQGKIIRSGRVVK
jgi:hypothetical protein